VYEKIVFGKILINSKARCYLIERNDIGPSGHGNVGAKSDRPVRRGVDPLRGQRSSNCGSRPVQVMNKARHEAEEDAMEIPWLYSNEDVQGSQSFKPTEAMWRTRSHISYTYKRGQHAPGIDGHC
jgi:hypothetical protein